MALDERRGAFDVHRLDPENDDAPRIQEWWFRGVHSDLGGGNRNTGRSNISLSWMLEQAHDAGLPLDMAAASLLNCNLDAPVSHNQQQGRWHDRVVLKGDRIHPSAGRLLAVGENVTVEVDSKLWFDFSGVLAEQGARYRFRPDPFGRWTDKTIECDASGWPAGINRGQTVFGWFKDKVLESNAAGLVRRVPDANWFEMVACIGSCGKPAVPIGRGQFDASPWTCPAAGPLFFFANDARLSGFGRNFYDNNDGVINVSIERLA